MPPAPNNSSYLSHNKSNLVKGVHFSAHIKPAQVRAASGPAPSTDVVVLFHFPVIWEGLPLENMLWDSVALASF